MDSSKPEGDEHGAAKKRSPRTTEETEKKVLIKNQLRWDLSLQLLKLFHKGDEFDRNKIVQLCTAALFPLRLKLDDEEMDSDSNAWFVNFIHKWLFEESGDLEDCSGQPMYKLRDSFYHHVKRENSSGSEVCCRVEDFDDHTGLSPSTVHCSLVLPSDHHVSPKIFNVLLHKSLQLQTLLLLGQHKYLVDQVPRELFLELKLLRILDLSYTSITELPSSFANLKSLMYLDVSGTPITRLPNFICGFQYMQTLRLRDCLKLVALPERLYMLEGLLHLDLGIVNQLITSMPPRIGRLKKLRTLPIFIVGKQDGCTIAELKFLDNLVGTLCISNLENVSNEEAESAALTQKCLDKLELRWTKSQYGSQVLGYLQPHRNIRELKIVGHEGPMFPSWFGDPSFSNLSTVTLYNCTCYNFVPSLARLPGLRTLHIGEMRGVGIIDHRRGCPRGLLLPDSSISDSLVRHRFPDFPLLTDIGASIFPRLNSLVLHGLPDLEEWTGVKEGDFPWLTDLKVSSCPKLTAFPELGFLLYLRRLEVSCCSQLQSLSKECSTPLFSSLESLLIMDCPILKEHYKEGGKYWCQISHIPDPWID